MATSLSSTPSQLRPSQSPSHHRLLSRSSILPFPRRHRRSGGHAVRASASASDGAAQDGSAVTVRRFAAAPTKGGKLAGVKKIMILGAGPIVIGQACEFDYSGTQAARRARRSPRRGTRWCSSTPTRPPS
ncbi:hypothetical protein ABZP36_014885 [Zizania latifolia]